MKIVFAVCGSFCNHKNALNALKEIISKGHEVTPVLSEIVCNTDTRFGAKDAFILNIEAMCGKKVITSIKEAEEILTPGQYDLLIICPCTGNTLAKIANGITDSTVTMTAKIFFRNRKAVLIALATNDALGACAKNIGMLCAGMANPIALNYANSTAEGDEPSVAYATVYPVTIFLRVIIAQITFVIFC